LIPLLTQPLLSPALAGLFVAGFLRGHALLIARAN
jgi:hypothetical protein